MITKRQLLVVFTDQVTIAAQLGITSQAVVQWPMDEPIPYLRELQIRSLYPKLFGNPREIVQRDVFKTKKKAAVA